MPPEDATLAEYKARLAKNKALVLEQVEHVVNRGDLDELDKRQHPRFVAHGLGKQAAGDGEGMKRLIRTWKTAFPDWKDEVLDVIAEDDTVVIRLKASGTHTGELLGIPPTGEAVSWNLMETVRIEDGLIIEQWGVPDFGPVVDRLRNAARAKATEEAG